jgi:steroid 5-alpha reductase family enzyme
METFFSVLGLNLLVILALMICLWGLSLVLKDAGIADIFWGLGFVIIAWITFVTAEGFVGRRSLITLLVTVWGLRLSLHIAFRNLGKGEDRRYRAWREKYGDRYWWVSLFTVFLTQGLLLWTIALVCQAGQLSRIPDTFVLLDVLGFLVWTTGFCFEAVADRQLQRFKADPSNKGKVMDRGLWGYSRHPNYFGESLIWWGLFLITMADPQNVWTVISPVTITFLLLKVSGVSLLEKTIKERRPEYVDYVKRTPAFVPWFPKKDHHDPD